MGGALLASINPVVTRPRIGLVSGRRIVALPAAFLLVAAATAAAGPSAAVSLPWHAAASPDIRGGANDLYAAGGSGPSDVWAVGGYIGLPNGPSLPLAEHWGGSSWQVVPAARPPGGGGDLLWRGGPVARRRVGGR